MRWLVYWPMVPGWAFGRWVVTRARAQGKLHDCRESWDG